MRVLVTGGTGFIGSAFCRNVVNAGWTVCNLDKLTYAASQASLALIEAHPHYHFAKGDICDSDTVSKLIADFRPDAIVNFAAETHVDRSITGSAAFIETNVVGTHVLLSAALAHWEKLPAPSKVGFRFLHVSTDEVFGSLGKEGFFTEITPYDPRSPYSASKASSDHLVRAWGHTYGLPVLISNCSNNYGPFQFPEKLIPLVILHGLEGKPLPVYGDGQNIRDWLYVDDHVEAIKLVLTKGEPLESYCVGGRNEKTNLEVVERICDLLDARAPRNLTSPRRSLITFVKDRPGHDRRYAIDAGKIRTELGWEPKHNFESGLAETVGWYLDNRAWWEPIRSGAYQGERLGLRTAI
ncbi:MAG: dTDP-glucose 4,6-dehydratase [Burkholderiales bacterium]|nr:MAG: dTDP-glucose 4,6-dehydratase [Burkholderiales bacterium]